MHPLAQLAKLAIETYIRKKKIAKIPHKLKEKYSQKKGGVFITLKKNGKLRGCIGTPLPTKKNILEEIIFNAISAATKDPRFLPVEKEELANLSYEVSILSSPKQIKSISELDPKKYGIIIESVDSFPKKRGLLLPNIEGIDDIGTQIFIAAQKGGIDLDKEKVVIYKFKVEKYDKN